MFKAPSTHQDQGGTRVNSLSAQPWSASTQALSTTPQEEEEEEEEEHHEYKELVHQADSVAGMSRVCFCGDQVYLFISA